MKNKSKSGLYRLDLSSAKNIELTDKPSRQLRKAIDKQLKVFKEKQYMTRSTLTKNESELNQGLKHLFKNSPDWGVKGGVGKQKKITLDFLRKQGVEILTDSKTLKRGAKARSTGSEYYLLKDFPKKRLSKEEIEKLMSWRDLGDRGYFNLGGQVLSDEQTEFIQLALAIHLNESN